MFSPKDFIETAEGLLFAVVSPELEQGKALCFLRYVNDGGQWRKQATDAANAFLRRRHPDYLHYSPVLDADLHAVALDRVVKRHQPRRRFLEIMQADRLDPIESDAALLGALLARQGVALDALGITGSVLIGMQNAASDIDLVCYGREAFQSCRAAVWRLIENGCLQELGEADWREAYRRRNCSLTYEDYLRHEKRKFNKALVNGRKFDISLVVPDEAPAPAVFQKIGAITLTCRITDATRAFDYPAVYRIDDETIDAIVCFTATYAGQAFAGEWVEVAGMLEQNAKGERQIVVGSSREAHGEHIKVIDAALA